MRRILAGMFLLAVACATHPRQTPAQSFAALESRLIAEESTNLDSDITSTGAVAVHTTGTLHSTGSDLLINVTGETGGQKTTTAYDANSPTLKRAAVLGFTRMGLLHNLVRLLGNQGIEHAEGGMEQWVQVTSVAYEPAERKYSFDIVIEGQPTGAAGLWIDAGGLPIRRQQTVQFPGGNIFVEERYTWR